jgi:hypothetical protein
MLLDGLFSVIEQGFDRFYSFLLKNILSIQTAEVLSIRY